MTELTENDKSVMDLAIADSKEYYGWDFSSGDFKDGFLCCYRFIAGDLDTESDLREQIKSVGVEDYFNDNLENVCRKLEEAYPEVVAELIKRAGK